MLQGRDCVHHFAAGIGGAKVVKHACDLAFRIDDEGAEYHRVELYVRSAEGAILFCYRHLPVGQKVEGQLLLIDVLLVGSNRIVTDPQNGHMQLLQLRQVTLEAVHVAGALLAEIVGIKIDHDPLATVVLQAYRLPILVHEREVGSRGAFRGKLRITLPAAGQEHSGKHQHTGKEAAQIVHNTFPW